MGFKTVQLPASPAARPSLERKSTSKEGGCRCSDRRDLGTPMRKKTTFCSPPTPTVVKEHSLIRTQPSPAHCLTLFRALRYHLHFKHGKLKQVHHGQTESLRQSEEPNQVLHSMLMPCLSFSITRP